MLRISAAVPVLLGCLPCLVRAEPDIHDTKFLTQPAVSARHIAFIYADDLWVANLDGSNVRRLTSDIGVETRPVFAPDGRSIAFSAEYEGNMDVYVIPVEGGSPRRLTWHPGPEVVLGFTPDGSAVLFASPRHVFTNRYMQLFTVPLSGGMATQLPIPHGARACFSPDAAYIAYNPLGDRSAQWKHYRGGTHARIWIYRRKDHAVVEVPQPAGRCNDLDPQWLGDSVYFRSDRAGEYNLFSYNTRTREIRQLTKHEGFPVLSLGAGGGRLIYEQAGHLYLFQPESGSAQRLKIGVASDLVETRPRFVKGAKYIRHAGVSPSGARAVFEFRGEIVTVPAAKGDPRNLTNSPGANDRSPAWSPDGKSIAYFSDASGEYELCVRRADGKGQPTSYTIRGAGFYDLPVWSPDSKKIAFRDNSQSLFFIDLDKKNISKIASEPYYGPDSLRMLRPAWSPDSKWIVYALGNRAGYHTIYAYELAVRKSRAITDGLSDAIDPVFDRDGKFLYLLASTDAGPVNHWFAQSNADMALKRTLHLVVLRKGVPSPLARESDEEKEVKSGKKSKKKSDANDGETSEAKAKGTSPAVVIDFDGIANRILALPIPAGNYANLQAGRAGHIYYLDRHERNPPSDSDGPRLGTLRHFELNKRKTKSAATGVNDYYLTADGKKALITSGTAKAASWSIIELSAAGGDSAKLKIDAIEVRIEPRTEWRQIFDEAWRVNRDYFYDPGMHGANWPAVKDKYAAFLPHLATRGDLDRVIQWMLSELAVGHSYQAPGERLHKQKSVPGGLLGADYEIANGRYRFKKVYGGLNWDPELRSPLTVPGVDVKAGEYLLAVRGIDLKPPLSLYALFENTAGKSIDITVGPTPDGKSSRTVTVEPLADEYALRNRDWVESNLRKVHAATKGRVAYVYVPNTAKLGHAYFKRYFFPQCDKEAIIIDERFNGGGQIADYYIDHLRRPFTAMWATRYGKDIVTPSGAIFGPKVMLIDETAGSGGDLLPWMFRKYKLGPLVGKRTWGGLVGILGFPVLMDGGLVTAPNLGFWDETGFGVENEGVPPDIDVEQTPAAVNAGRDPQLERAIEIVLRELEKSPPRIPSRPAFPVRVKR
jgi:tricorn protease